MNWTLAEYKAYCQEKAKPKKRKQKRTAAAKLIEEALQQHRIDTLQKRTGYKVVAEHQFHPERKWRFDFFFPEVQMAVEVEGGVWLEGGGRHNRGKGYIGDLEKYNQAQTMGIQVLRFTPDQLLCEEAIQIINKAIAACTK